MRSFQHIFVLQGSITMSMYAVKNFIGGNECMAENKKAAGKSKERLELLGVCELLKALFKNLTNNRSQTDMDFSNRCS